MSIKSFDEMYDISNLSTDNIFKIAKYIANNDDFSDYTFIGIRAIEPEYAEELRPSYRWDDGEMTDEQLNGVSAYNTDIDTVWDDVDTIADKLSNAIESSKCYVFGSRKPFIVMGTDGEGGEDINEIIIYDPIILDISKCR